MARRTLSRLFLAMVSFGSQRLLFLHLCPTLWSGHFSLQELLWQQMICVSRTRCQKLFHWNIPCHFFQVCSAQRTSLCSKKITIPFLQVFCLLFSRKGQSASVQWEIITVHAQLCICVDSSIVKKMFVLFRLH